MENKIGVMQMLKRKSGMTLTQCMALTRAMDKGERVFVACKKDEDFEPVKRILNSRLSYPFEYERVADPARTEMRWLFNDDYPQCLVAWPMYYTVYVPERLLGYRIWKK